MYMHKYIYIYIVMEREREDRMKREMFWTRGGLGSQIWSGGTPQEGKKKKKKRSLHYGMYGRAEQTSSQKENILCRIPPCFPGTQKNKKKNMNKHIDEGNLLT